MSRVVARYAGFDYTRCPVLCLGARETQILTLRKTGGVRELPGGRARSPSKLVEAVEYADSIIKDLMEEVQRARE